jgi:hypothetical protein
LTINAADLSGSTILAENIKAGSVTPDTVPADSITFSNTMAVVASSNNWRKVAKDLIGDEPVTYEQVSVRDSLRKFPLVKITSHDKEALDRVLTKAAEVE